MKALFCSLLILGIMTLSLVSADRDPFLSPFEPQKEKPKQKSQEPSKEDTSTEPQKKSELDSTLIAKVKKLLNESQIQKATEILENIKKDTAEIKLPEHDIETLEELGDQLKNLEQYKKFIADARALMDIQGKVLLNNKKNILLVNNQSVIEGENLKDLLKLEHSVFLQEIKEDSFTLRYKDIILSFHLD